jgi:hypothetical protein
VCDCRFVVMKVDNMCVYVWCVCVCVYVCLCVCVVCQTSTTVVTKNNSSIKTVCVHACLDIYTLCNNHNNKIQLNKRTMKSAREEEESEGVCSSGWLMIHHLNSKKSVFQNGHFHIYAYTYMCSGGMEVVYISYMILHQGGGTGNINNVMWSYTHECQDTNKHSFLIVNYSNFFAARRKNRISELCYGIYFPVLILRRAVVRRAGWNGKCWD